ncbi:MAG: tyrosine-type recombinase/integrase [Leptolyngbyaceae cyanobacterium RM1_405_57]|nr:tyrosine-type recombinase/integrase [Leptolyngbyaceae cyanobacterium RM1_405_57]
MTSFKLCGSHRHDQAKILSADELTQLFTQGFATPRDRALFGICLYTACRINEACSLHTADVFGARGEVRERITFRRESTKGKQSTRSIPVSGDLRELLVRDLRINKVRIILEQS